MNTVINRQNKTVVIFSSPHISGHTSKNLKIMLDKLKIRECTILNPYSFNIYPCIDCKKCYNAECVYNLKDDFNKFITEIYSADIIICATPIYFNSVPAKLKLIIDRCQQYFLKNIVKKEPFNSSKKLGFLLTTSGIFDEQSIHSVYSQIKMFFSCLNINLLAHYYVANTDNIDNIISNFNEIGNIAVQENDMEEL